MLCRRFCKAPALSTMIAVFASPCPAAAAEQSEEGESIEHAGDLVHAANARGEFQS